MKNIAEAILGLATILFATSPAQAARIIAEHGYDNLIELRNDSCRVVLEPNLGGRVLNYELNGVEVLYQDPAQAGLHPTNDKGVPRIAGGRFDFGPSFGERPRRTLWQGEWSGEITGEYSARLTSQVDPDCGVQLIRNFTLAPEGSHLRCEQIIINHSDQPLWTLHWSRTMANGGGIAFAPIPETGHFPNGYALSTGSRGEFDFLPEPEPAIRIRENILEFLEAPSQDKAIFNLSAGWMAYLNQENVLFVKKFPFNPTWRYGDPPQHHGSYWWLEDKMLEFEPNGPLEVIPPGGRASFHEDWWLIGFAFPEDRTVDLDKLRGAMDACAVVAP